MKNYLKQGREDVKTDLGTASMRATLPTQRGSPGNDLLIRMPPGQG